MLQCYKWSIYHRDIRVKNGRHILYLGLIIESKIQGLARWTLMSFFPLYEHITDIFKWNFPHHNKTLALEIHSGLYIFIQCSVSERLVRSYLKAIVDSPQKICFIQWLLECSKNIDVNNLAQFVKLLFILFFETGCHISQVCLKLLMKPRMMFSYWFFCPSLSSGETIAVHLTPRLL